VRISVNTDELRIQAERLLQLRAAVETAQQQIRSQLDMLEEQTCEAEKEAMRSTIRQLQQELNSIDDLQSDLLKIAAIYENTDSDVTGMIRALPADGDIPSPVAPQYRPLDAGIEWNIIRLADITHCIGAGQVYMLQYMENTRPIAKWADKQFFIIPEGVLRVDDWLKYRLMEAYAHEHI